MSRYAILCCCLFKLILSYDATGQSVHFHEPVDISKNGVAGVTSLDAADFNGDGLLDVVVLEGGKHAVQRTFAWFEQKSRDEWVRHELGSSFQLDSFLGSARCADLDEDGDPDIVFTSDKHTSGPVKVMIVKNPGGRKAYGQWSVLNIASFEGSHANDMDIADMNNDGKNDIIIRHKTPNTIRILFQQNNQEWRVRSLSTEKLGNEGFAVGYLNKDSIPDIAVNGYWFKAPGDPRRGSYKLFPFDTLFTRVNGNTKEDIGDINGDGFNDIIISPAEGYYDGKNHVLAWYQAPADPELPGWIQHIIKNDYNWAHFVKLVDIDNDKDLDVISGQAWTPMGITIFINNNTDFSENVIVAKGRGIYSWAIKDMDNDGDLDIVGEDTYSNRSLPWIYQNLLVP